LNNGDLIEEPKYGTSKKCSYKSSGLGVLRIPNIGDKFIEDDDLKFASFTKEEIDTYSLKENDVLIIRSNGSVELVGKCALIKKRDTNYLYAGYLIRLRPIKNIINSKYLIYCLSSIDLRVQIESKAKSTSGVNNINSGELCSLHLPICSKTEQNEIVKAIESRLSVCDTLEQSITESLEKSNFLRQSILKKAFEGKLLSKAELEKCKQDKNYEPASELLKKIEAEKLK
ncbi:MAG: restriction endonuclease subunit S, partial [Candidatus Marithrix sp.]